MKSMAGQLDIFSFMESTFSKKSQNEVLSYPIGTIMYEVKLDKTRKFVVENSYEYDLDGETAYGYFVHDTENTQWHNTLLQRNIGISVFIDEKEAKKKAEENAVGIKKFTADVLRDSLIDIRSFITISPRIPKSTYQLKTMALTKQGIYIKDYCCYPFLHIYQDFDAAQKAFQKMCQKTFDTTYSSNLYIEEIYVHFEFEDVYRCTESKYSALEYTYNHGSPYGDDKKYEYGKLISEASK